MLQHPLLPDSSPLSPSKPDGFLPNPVLADHSCQVALEVYRQRYETYRHLDRQRWQTPSILFATSVVLGLTAQKNGVPSWWALIGFAVFAGCSWYLMRRIRFRIDENTVVLRKVGSYLGDSDVPLPSKQLGAASLYEMAVAATAVITAGVGLLALFTGQ